MVIRVFGSSLVISQVGNALCRTTFTSTLQFSGPHSRQHYSSQDHIHVNITVLRATFTSTLQFSGPQFRLCSLPLV